MTYFYSSCSITTCLYCRVSWPQAGIPALRNKHTVTGSNFLHTTVQEQALLFIVNRTASFLMTGAGIGASLTTTVVFTANHDSKALHAYTHKLIVIKAVMNHTFMTHNPHSWFNAYRMIQQLSAGDS